ncbi:MAG TPA: tripartite tricarboxylate transporter substrate binding protein [Xanthobacteraceae bacterium]|jgi:tripartite-type tricarboxylate transporter receptor subunit TctC|nr:tripartite tricarboxylate transporter substrate binding protein [Xanthobacteraceae bacterium]
MTFAARLLSSLSTALLMVCLSAAAGSAQDFPTRPIRIIVPFAPGGSTDAVVRILAKKLSDNLGGSVYIENRPGGAATIGTNQVAQAAPDGYTLGAANISFGANPAILKRIPYDTEKDFVPVGLVARVPLVLAVHPSVPAKSVKELIALARAKPGGLSYASAGYGSGSHLSMELFNYLTGLKMLHVPYNGGGPQVAGALGGQITALFATIPSSMQYFASGQLVGLGVSTAKRDPRLPDLPTIAEAGVPGYEMGDWVGLIAPKDTPSAIVERLNREMLKALADPEVKSRIESVGTQVAAGTPEDLRVHIQSELAKWRKVAETMKLHIDN